LGLGGNFLTGKLRSLPVLVGNLDLQMPAVPARASIDANAGERKLDGNALKDHDVLLDFTKFLYIVLRRFCRRYLSGEGQYGHEDYEHLLHE
jgi:hypothetical protein